MYISYRLSHHPQDHPNQSYADHHIPLVSLLFEKVIRSTGGALIQEGRLFDIMV